MKLKFEYLAFVGIFLAMGSPFLSFTDFNQSYINISIISGIIIFAIGLFLFGKKLDLVDKKISKMENDRKND